MKCVVGIDLERRSESAIALLGRLQFDVEETTLLHITEPMQLALPYSAYGMFVETDEIYETLQKAGQEVLAEESKTANQLGLHPKSELCEGFPTTALTDFADQLGASIIAVTSTVRSTVSAVFGGSVARGLAISAKQSVLVAREDMPPEGPLRAVFAIDQSPYCSKCIELLAKLGPKGISHITLLTVHEQAKHEGLLSRIHTVNTKALIEEADKKLTENGELVAKWLTGNGIPTSSRVETGNVDETIHRVMNETKADLLIVGSQGHGFMDRVLVGSTSLHEVVNERYPVLLLRLPPDPVS